MKSQSYNSNRHWLSGSPTDPDGWEINKKQVANHLISDKKELYQRSFEPSVTVAAPSSNHSLLVVRTSGGGVSHIPERVHRAVSGFPPLTFQLPPPCCWFVFVRLFVPIMIIIGSVVFDENTHWIFFSFFSSIVNTLVTPLNPTSSTDPIPWSWRVHRICGWAIPKIKNKK